MVKVMIINLLLLITIAQISLASEPSPQENETPISDRRKFTEVKKFKILPVVKKPKFIGWLPSFFGQPEVTEAPLIGELVPLNQYPIWKIHKYKGIELQPLPIVDTPTKALDLPVIRGEPPEAIQLPQYGPPVAEYGAPPQSSQSGNENGTPASEYGPPASEYGPPSEYGAPPSEYGAPSMFRVERENKDETSGKAEETTNESAATDEETQNSLDALSNLGSLTSLLGEGNANNLARLQVILQLFRNDQSLFTKLKNLKSWKFQSATSRSATEPPPPPESAIYYPELKKESKSLFSSFVPRFFRQTSSVPLPALPEVDEVSVTGMENLNIQLPELPPISLPAYSNDQLIGPYVKVNVGGKAPPPIPVRTAAPPPSFPAPPPSSPAPPTPDFKYPVAPQQPIYQPVPVLPYQNFPSNTPVYNSYGVAVPPYSLPSDSKPFPANSYSVPDGTYPLPANVYSSLPISAYSAPADPYAPAASDPQPTYVTPLPAPQSTTRESQPQRLVPQEQQHPQEQNQKPQLQIMVPENGVDVRRENATVVREQPITDFEYEEPYVDDSSKTETDLEMSSTQS